MSSVEYQTEEDNYASDISIHEYESKTLNEKFLWNALRQAETKIKILQ